MLNKIKTPNKNKKNKKKEENIITTCNHEFIEDYIDVDLDTSIKIKYCKLCEYTKN